MNQVIDKYKLMNKNRIDIIVGIEYNDFYENKYNTDFFIDLYIELKRCFNNLQEQGLYKGKEQFIERFNNVINGIKKEKTNLVKVPTYNYNNENWIVDGFHRVSTLLYHNFNMNIDIQIQKKPINICYYPTNIYFFKNRKYDIKYCNYAMYCFLKKYVVNFSCIILFPNNKILSTDLLNEIKEHIIYDINIPLVNFKNNFKNNFIQSLYYNEEWCKNGRYKNKAEKCFNKGENLKIYFIEKQNPNMLINYKKKVREYYNIGNDSIHIPDTQEECNSLLDLLNYNTLSFMNKAPSLYINFSNFNKFFHNLKKFCKENNVDTKKICITSSSVLSVYGIRDCGDMDLFIDKKCRDIFKNTCFDDHSNYTLDNNKYTIDKHYSTHFEDIIYNPNNHFYFQGIKFCNLSIILDYKKYRVKNNLYGKKSIEKDNRDINSINNLKS